MFDAIASRADRYLAIGKQIATTVIDKQAAYGDSFGRSGAVMAILFPRGVLPAQFDDALAIVRVIDKLFRIATDRDALGESPWRDIAGYAILAAERVERERENLASLRAQARRESQASGPALGSSEDAAHAGRCAVQGAAR